MNKVNTILIEAILEKSGLGIILRGGGGRGERVGGRRRQEEGGEMCEH